MAFLTELFSRPRPQDAQRCRSALAVPGTTGRDCIVVKPADFPRIARARSVR